MTDAVILRDGELLTAPRLRLHAAGWVEHKNEDGGTVALTPPQRVQQVLLDIEQFDLSRFDLETEEPEPDQEAAE